MDRERAETYLRLLAEGELRHAAWAAPVSAGRWPAGRTDATSDKMRWVALALTSVRALEVETAEAVHPSQRCERNNGWRHGFLR